jgi:hypothetical protein
MGIYKTAVSKELITIEKIQDNLSNVKGRPQNPTKRKVEPDF